MTEDSQSTDEAQIRLLLGEWVDALRVKDIDKILLLYSPHVVTFDVVPPLQYVGIQAYRNSFRRMFDGFQGSIAFETRDLSITVVAEVAFSHSLVRTIGTMSSGQEIDRWLRRTLCLRRISGKWLVTHEHVSLPVNPESGKAVQDLQP